MLALLTFWCPNRSGNMGAEDGGVLAPNQFTAAKCFSELFGWLLGDFFYIGKKKYISAQMFLSGYKPAGYKCAVPPASDSTLSAASKDTQRREQPPQGSLKISVNSPDL